MKAYISISYQRRRSLNTAITAIMSVLEEHQIESFVFVDHYKFEESQEEEMMRSALAELEQCDLLIAETSHKGIGIGIEAGYAKAKNKPVVYLRHKEAEHSTTLSGASDHRVIYKNTDDLQKQLVLIIKEIIAATEPAAVVSTSQIS
ncbi:nucleoside 2-deoxyribosyltransferase [Lacibacter sediminis]|uniref:Nucleoside 2-deoxyribosyltransferase n=1 Tax=Lacibacter sediminis TaxID=2760713 RepID=A0A7G5XLQ2_9BACT|nr:nucleoside 2-deoxyribosyltransferase [Lacibacter sediminis]QNA46405.1 nucleoside 2-deoxyribosyltransferase [Lacibacter sediminis]